MCSQRVCTTARWTAWPGRTPAFMVTKKTYTTDSRGTLTTERKASSLIFDHRVLCSVVRYIRIAYLQMTRGPKFIIEICFLKLWHSILAYCNPLSSRCVNSHNLYSSCYRLLIYFRFLESRLYLTQFLVRFIRWWRVTCSCTCRVEKNSQYTRLGGGLSPSPQSVLLQNCRCLLKIK